MPKMIDGVLVWGAEHCESNTIEQAARAARLPFVPFPVALMPDAHVGFGSTVGSVIPTLGAIIPAAIGVDIGCGMAAVDTHIRADQLPDDLGRLHGFIRASIPAGVGKGKVKDIPGLKSELPKVLRDKTAFLYMDQQNRAIAANQLGSLGSGNHFVEVCLDQLDSVWLVLHSGSRGVGKRLAEGHIKAAKGLMKKWFIDLEDPELAYLVEGTPQFDAYITDMHWAQEYAAASRAEMIRAGLRSLEQAMPNFQLVDNPALHIINTHHNYTTKEHHRGHNVWLTRKGAISARAGEWGIIPGSMGTSSYIVRGLGNPASFYSSSHGAGRRLSRGAARKELTVDTLRVYMDGKTWDDRSAVALLDEHPDAYKDIDQVMRDQSDLVEVEYTLHQVLNYKGTS
jgi:tRNA-splicing ligase RtcB (3'-phosphate/5'-hydroxy nucleic acid ligase)